MSYKKPHTGNTMNDYFTRLMDFTRLSSNLLEADSDNNFEIWLDKLIQIDRRSLILFLKKNSDKIPNEYMERAKIRLGDKWFQGVKT